MRAFLCTIAIVGAGIAACSASGTGNGFTEGAGGANSMSAGPGPGVGVGNPSGAGGSTGPFSGTVGSGASDAGISDVDFGDGACNAIAQEAKPELQPADIIWAIDTSGSMIEETQFVVQQMNNFSQQIVASGIDIRVIMLAGYPACFPVGFCLPGICILPPLGKAGGCMTNPFDDSNPPSYIHLGNVPIGSTDGLNVLINSYPQWKQHLRANSTKTVVVITDDDATDPPNNNATTFINNFKALDPPMLGNFKMSGIYCFNSCPQAANPGYVWKDVITQTGGVHGDLCLQNFQPVFDDLATQIITGSQKLDCQWTIPPPPAGQTFDPKKVNVKFTDSNGMQKDIFFASSQSACDPVNGGWYYDNNTNPTTIYACPASCMEIQAAVSGKIDILFGCATIDLPPPT